MGVHRCILASSPLPALSPSLLPLSFLTISLGILCTHVLTVFSPSHAGGTVLKNLPAKTGDARDMGSISGLGRPPGGGNGNPFQYSFLENPMEEEPGSYSP